MIRVFKKCLMYVERSILHRKLRRRKLYIAFMNTKKNWWTRFFFFHSVNGFILLSDQMLRENVTTCWYALHEWDRKKKKMCEYQESHVCEISMCAAERTSNICLVIEFYGFDMHDWRRLSEVARAFVVCPAIRPSYLSRFLVTLSLCTSVCTHTHVVEKTPDGFKVLGDTKGPPSPSSCCSGDMCCVVLCASHSLSSLSLGSAVWFTGQLARWCFTHDTNCNLPILSLCSKSSSLMQKVVVRITFLDDVTPELKRAHART